LKRAEERGRGGGAPRALGHQIVGVGISLVRNLVGWFSALHHDDGGGRWAVLVSAEVRAKTCGKRKRAQEFGKTDDRREAGRAVAGQGGSRWSSEERRKKGRGNHYPEEVSGKGYRIKKDHGGGSQKEKKNV